MNKNVIIGVDPGYDRCGIAVINSIKGVGAEELLFSTCVQTSQKNDFHTRLKNISNAFNDVLEKFQPGVLSIENLYFNTNQKTASKVLEVKGAIEILALNKNLLVYEYTPLQIKNAIAGNGRAGKREVYSMLKHLIKINKEIKIDDEFDAIACALTCSASIKFQ